MVYENWNSTIQYAPAPWSVVKGVDWVPNTSNPQPYVETNVSLSSASLNFTGGVAVAINAPRNWGHWTYNVVRILSLYGTMGPHSVIDFGRADLELELQHTLGYRRRRSVLSE